MLLLLLLSQMALSRRHDGSTNQKVPAGEANTRAGVLDVGAAGFLEWRLRTSRSDGTFFGEESSGSSLDAASDLVGGGDQS